MIRAVRNNDMAHIVPADSFRQWALMYKLESGRTFNPWHQFIIGSAIRLLYARRLDGHYIRIYPDALRIVRKGVLAALKGRPEREITFGSHPYKFDPYTESILLQASPSESPGKGER